MARMKIGEMLRLACIYAEQDREGFIAAYDHMPDDPARVKAVDFLRQLKTYIEKRWGRSEQEKDFENAKAVPVSEVAARTGSD